MDPSHKTHVAYIDGANLHKGVASSNWKLDYRHFRSWIRQKYGITEAKLFIGLMPKNADLYTSLQNAGFQLVFKEVVYDGTGKAKGNCDADLVLHAVRDFYEHQPSSVIIISSDGDYAPLKKCSWLLRKTNASILCLDDVRNKLTRKGD